MVFLDSYVLRNWDYEVDNILIGKPWMCIACHHVAGLGECQIAAENGREVVGKQLLRVVHAQDVKLRENSRRSRRDRLC